ncbi:hypothetical protein GCM10009761_02330 [Agromyces terreus]
MTLALAVVFPLLVWAAAVPLAGLDLMVGSGAAAQRVAPPAIVVAALFAGCAAWAVLALLERFTRSSGRIFAVIGWTVLALSLLGPVLTGAKPAVLGVLLAMHLVTGATLMIGLPRPARRHRTTAEGRDVDWRRDETPTRPRFPNE